MADCVAFDVGILYVVAAKERVREWPQNAQQ